MLDDHRLGGGELAVLDADHVEAVGLLTEVNNRAEGARAEVLGADGAAGEVANCAGGAKCG